MRIHICPHNVFDNNAYEAKNGNNKRKLKNEQKTRNTRKRYIFLIKAYVNIVYWNSQDFYLPFYCFFSIYKISTN